MKTLLSLVVATLWVVVCQAQPSPALPPADAPRAASPRIASTNEPANYVISVQWKDTKLGSSFVQMMTAEGPFNLDALEHSTMKINGPEIPTTIRLSGDLTCAESGQGPAQIVHWPHGALHDGRFQWAGWNYFTVLPTAFGGIGFHVYRHFRETAGDSGG